MNQNTLAFLGRDFNEIEDALCCLIVLIEEYLAFNVLPEESQVDYIKAFPLILDLFASAINDPRHFVHLYEVEVLSHT